MPQHSETQVNLPKLDPEGNIPPARFKIRLPGGAEELIEAGRHVREVVPAKSPAGHPVVAAKFNNKVSSLDRPIDKDATIDFVDTCSRDGGLIYRRSLTFLLIRAIHDLYPDLHVYINHSLNGGYYGEVYTDAFGASEKQILSEADLARILERMRALVDADEPFVRTELPVKEAIERFRAAGMMDKVHLLKYRENDLVSVYRCGPIINHFYGQLVPSTGYLQCFDLRACDPGFVLLFPPYGKPDQMPVYHHDEKLFAVFQEYERWSRILGMRKVADLNGLVDSGMVNEYVLVSEALMEKKIASIADRICSNVRNPRIILLSGPSASGKTTTVKRLSIQLRVNGKRPTVIGLDDFFLEREKTPRDEHGEYDFEAFEAIDAELLQQCLRRLLRGEEVQLPKFDFVAGKPVPGKKLRIEPGQPVILEGIHALNPNLLPGIHEGMKFKLYISPLSHLNIDDHNRIASSDSRLIRRLVRDSRYRGYDAVATLGRWPSVRRGEQKNIFPYQGEADYVLNSSLPYEVCVLRQHAVPLLEAVPRDNPLYSEAARLAKFMSYFRDIKESIVPRHSLLREFIGGSAFKY